MNTARIMRSYYVDEAGDPIIFGKKGSIMLGKEGCSKYFILGVLDGTNQENLSQELIELRAQLLADPYFKNVPSMQPSERKTYYTFHAKDDLPEVRREVFSILRKHKLRFLAVVRNKHKVLEYVRQRNANDPNYHYNPNELYDFMVRVLFKNLLHKDPEYSITFSKRGNQDRTQSLRNALESAQRRFAEKWIINDSYSTINVIPQSPKECIYLQVVDYFLWALQRFYEKQEDRYLELLWSSFSLVHDIDDTREAQYGRYYTQKRPLTIAVFDNSEPGI